MAAVDDAGSGYSSLQHIMEMRPNFIKLDRNFITNCDSDPAKSVLIEMLGKAANRLDAWIIAEGIETKEELAELIRLGVPLVQGTHWCVDCEAQFFPWCDSGKKRTPKLLVKLVFGPAASRGKPQRSNWPLAVSSTFE